MKTLNCCFCGTEVAAPANLNDPTARAVCDACYTRGGRLPKRSGPRPWAVHVDSRGRVDTSKFTRKWIRRNFAPNAAVATLMVVTILPLGIFIPVLVFKAAFMYPMASALFWSGVVVVYAACREAIRRWL
jgi:hypothetical protein